jgi:hypothetical protein
VFPPSGVSIIEMQSKIVQKQCIINSTKLSQVSEIAVVAEVMCPFLTTTKLSEKA